jgi:hypothetical protein
MTLILTSQKHIYLDEKLTEKSTVSDPEDFFADIK